MNICTAKCLVHYENLWTFELTYPRYIHSEFMTHRSFSRNASSSRAIPVKRMIEQVENNPVIPPEVYMNERGMVGREKADAVTSTAFTVLWEEAAESACNFAKMMEHLGIHKQHINRILEPFQFIKVIVTATEWHNFFVLRLAHDAQPEMQELAKAIYDEMERYRDKKVGCFKISNKSSVISLPYITKADFDEVGGDNYKVLMRISAARCARVSYNNHDGSAPDIKKDLELYERLYRGHHMSPMEHVCIRSHKWSKNANLSGWKSLRFMVETYEYQP